ncbi:hypothetical protein HAX54_045177 [Datura stramonium]|uniref:Uncharacterized protein n=1 Tax=Datura stramonium TaxID=4076 RepID=A0ABS8WFI2_DATST|nr:hypothetical protein [Datura stramonium]
MNPREEKTYVHKKVQRCLHLFHRITRETPRGCGEKSGVHGSSTLFRVARSTMTVDFLTNVLGSLDAAGRRSPDRSKGCNTKTDPEPRHPAPPKTARGKASPVDVIVRAMTRLFDNGELLFRRSGPIVITIWLVE